MDSESFPIQKSRKVSAAPMRMYLAPRIMWPVLPKVSNPHHQLMIAVANKINPPHEAS
jgi:hypothetical protein